MLHSAVPSKSRPYRKYAIFSVTGVVVIAVILTAILVGMYLFTQGQKDILKVQNNNKDGECTFNTCTQVACRGSWMPEANNVLGCPRKYFLFIPQNFWRRCLSNILKFFHFFASVVKFHKNSLLGCPHPSVVSCLGNDIFLFFFVIYM